MNLIGERLFKFMPIYEDNNIMNLYQGIPIVINNNLIVGHKQKKKHKNKLINRILFKLYGTEPIYDTKHIYYIDGKIYMSPIMFDKIKETINNG